MAQYNPGQGGVNGGAPRGRRKRRPPGASWATGRHAGLLFWHPSTAGLFLLGRAVPRAIGRCIHTARRRDRRGHGGRIRARRSRGGRAAGLAQLRGRSLAARRLAGAGLPCRTRLSGHLFSAGGLPGRRLPLRGPGRRSLPAGRLPLGSFLGHGLTPSSACVWKPEANTSQG